ncbi:MAG: aminoacyl-tRNA deacylase [Mycetocola sp.]
MTDHRNSSEPDDRAAQDAHTRGLAVTFIDNHEARSLPEAAAAIGIAPAQLYKSMLVRVSTDHYVLALVPGDRSISWPLLRRAVGVNRLTLPDADEAFTATGYRRGTITPLGCTPPRDVIIDEQARGQRIGIGSGVAGRSALVNADELIQAYGATVAPISAEPAA